MHLSAFTELFLAKMLHQAAHWSVYCIGSSVPAR
jgi:hypothetical protein